MMASMHGSTECHARRMLMVGARTNQLAVRDGDGAVASLVVALAEDARTH